MEAPEEAMGSNSSDCGEFIHAAAAAASAVVVKGKRTKRQRLHLPALPAVSSTAITDSSSASSIEIEASAGSITEEEEDMANCLILLAQGGTLDAGPEPKGPTEEGSSDVDGATEKFTSGSIAEAATTTNGKAGYYLYECKTCNKCFPSFQALGGHRASHKKPKLAAATTPTTAVDDKKVMVDEDILQISMSSFSKLISVNSQSSSKTKVHECSICGSEFNSGQALGGHMRRHRPLVIPNHNNLQEGKKERNLLSLDLNLPAPSDEELNEFQRPPSPAFSFNSNRPLIFSASASALVDCHY